MSTAQRAIKNFSFLLSSNLIAHTVNFLILVILARRLGAYYYGILAFAQAVLTYFSLLANFGLNTYGIREIARHRDRIKSIVGTVMTLQVILSILSLVFLSIFIFLIPKPGDEKIFILLFGGSMLLTGFYFDWVYKGLERMGIVSISLLIRSFVYAALILLLVNGDDAIYWIPISHIISMLCMIGLPLIMFSVEYSFPKFVYDNHLWKVSLKVGLRLFLSYVLIQIYYNIDIFMLGLIKTNDVVGYYSAAYRIVFIVLTLATVLMEVIFPILSRLYKKSINEFQNVFSLSERIYTGLAVPIGIGGTLLAKPIIIAIFGNEYADAVPVFQILIWTMFIMFLYAPSAFALIASDNEKHYLVSVAAGAGVNVLLNAIMIPLYGMIGAAIATVISEVAVLIGMINYSRKITKIGFPKYAIRPIIASIPMGLFLQYVHLNIALSITVGASIYLCVLSIIGGIRRRDLLLFRKGRAI